MEVGILVILIRLSKELCVLKYFVVIIYLGIMCFRLIKHWLRNIKRNIMVWLRKRKVRIIRLIKMNLLL